KVVPRRLINVSAPTSSSQACARWLSKPSLRKSWKLNSTRCCTSHCLAFLTVSQFLMPYRTKLIAIGTDVTLKGAGIMPWRVRFWDDAPPDRPGGMLEGWCESGQYVEGQ